MKLFRTAYLLLALAVAGTAGCFSIPFIGGGSGPPPNFEPQQADFSRDNVFVGYDDDGRAIVEMRLVSQEVTVDHGLRVTVRLFPTENFEVVNIFRGLRSISYYPIERRFHKLKLRYGRRDIEMKVTENLEVREEKPMNAVFEHDGVWTLLPDSIDGARLKFQDVDRWARLSADSLDAWYVAKDQFLEQAERQRRRSSLVEIYRERQEEDFTQTFTQYDSLYVTTNNAYVFLEKDTQSDILFALNAGDRLEYGVSDGVWVEVPVPDSLQRELTDLFDRRQQNAVHRRQMQENAARSSGRPVQPGAEVDTSYRTTGYILDAMVSDDWRRSISWERDNLLQPVDVPLFAQVLADRETARIARRDSLEKARQDSLQAIQDSLDAIAAADSVVGADSIAAAEVIVDTTAADTSTAAAAVKADTAATAAETAADTSVAAQQAGGQFDDRPVRTLTGPDGQTWTGRGPPPWAGARAREQGENPGVPVDPGDPAGNGRQPSAPDSAAADTSSAGADGQSARQ